MGSTQKKVCTNVELPFFPLLISLLRLVVVVVVAARRRRGGRRGSIWPRVRQYVTYYELEQEFASLLLRFLSLKALPLYL